MTYLVVIDYGLFEVNESKRSSWTESNTKLIGVLNVEICIGWLRENR